MKYQVIDTFRVKTSQGERELLPGQIISLATEKAVKLLSDGKITTVEKAAYKFYSEILRAYLWVVYGPEDMAVLRAQGIPEAIYTGPDLGQLKKLPKEHLRVIHEAKEVFPLSLIEEITTEKGDRQ